MKVKVPVTVTDCITERPPLPEKIDFEACEGYEACLDLRNAARLLNYIHRVQMYMEDWYAACGRK